MSAPSSAPSQDSCVKPDQRYIASPRLSSSALKPLRRRVVVGRGWVKYVFRHIKAIQLRPVREPSLQRRLAISFPRSGYNIQHRRFRVSRLISGCVCRPLTRIWSAAGGRTQHNACQYEIIDWEI